MPQAARVVSRVFLDDVASVVSGTAAPRLGYVTFRGTAPTGSAASAQFLRWRIGPLPVEHKRGKNGLFWLSTGTIRHEMDSGRCRSEDKAST